MNQVAMGIVVIVRQDARDAVKFVAMGQNELKDTKMAKRKKEQSKEIKEVKSKKGWIAKKCAKTIVLEEPEQDAKNAWIDAGEMETKDKNNRN